MANPYATGSAINIYSDGHETLLAKVVSIGGQIVKTIEINPGVQTTQFQIETGLVSGGIYFINISSRNGVELNQMFLSF